MVKRCFNCQDVITDENVTVEHILLDSLSGSNVLKSKELICQKCNSEFGHDFDSEVFDQLRTFGHLLGLSKSADGIWLVDKNGERHDINFDFTPKHKIRVKFEDSKPYTIVPGTDANFLKAAETQKQNFIKRLEKQGEEYKDEYYQEKFQLPIRYPANKYSDNTPYFKLNFNNRFKRHMLKVAIEYFLYLGYNSETICDAIDDFKKNRFSHRVLNFYPKNQVYVPSEGEISHLLYLKQDSELGIIYCLVEYFNFTSSIIILNDSFADESNKHIYCYDTVLKEEKSIGEKLLSAFEKYEKEIKNKSHFNFTETSNSHYERLWTEVGKILFSRGQIRRMTDD